MGKFYIKIIVEGNEEETFFNIVKEAGTHENIVLEILNAEGFGKIPDYFLNTLREEIYDLVICAYDVDNKALDNQSPYNITRTKLNLLFGDKSITESVSFCTNPNILQFFLLATDSLDNVKLTTTSKKANSSLVHKYWKEISSVKTDEQGRNTKPNYDASKWQLEIIKNSIIYGPYSYLNILNNAKDLSIDYKNDLPGSNLLELLIALKDGDVEYFNRIRRMLDEV